MNDAIIAKRSLQLLMPRNPAPVITEAQRAQYRLTVQTNDIKDRLTVSFAENHRNGSAKMDFREPKTFFNDYEGPGGKTQFTADAEAALEVTELKDLLTDNFDTGGALGARDTVWGRLQFLPINARD